MSRLNHLIACLGEEAGEVSQAVGKIQRFGLFDFNPKKAGSEVNIINLSHEVHDLVAVFEMIVEELPAHLGQLNHVRIAQKKEKVEKYIRVAKEVKNPRGQV